MVLQGALGAAINININWHLPPLFLKIFLGVKRLRLAPRLRKIGPGEQRDTAQTVGMLQQLGLQGVKGW